MVDSLSRFPHSVDNPLAANMEAAAKEVLFLMRLRLQEKGLQIPDALHYLGERLSAKYRRPGVQLQKVIEAAIQSQPEVYQAVFPHLDLDLKAPITEVEELFVRDLAAAKRGELSTDYIDARIDNFLFSEPVEKAA